MASLFFNSCLSTSKSTMAPHVKKSIDSQQTTATKYGVVKERMKDRVVERMDRSDSSHGWFALGNDYGFAIIGGPRNHVVVHHQAPRAR
ncbi:hypothetical protein C4D60_Mb11t17880 [Musa balbisiana]|uniref:Uncharacterized protein n=1 Tax=Musa balbisiana TaxID=52838 RepID=A0A4S8J5W2_MUSBA|nr:hypothetical protein C4D60_Mb11t17880 [Musa balbisiana]